MTTTVYAWANQLKSGDIIVTPAWIAWDVMEPCMVLYVACTDPRDGDTWRVFVIRQSGRHGSFSYASYDKAKVFSSL